MHHEHHHGSHHMDHGSHHMGNETTTDMGSLLNATAATIMQAVMSTVMMHDHASSGGHHMGHMNDMPADNDPFAGRSDPPVDHGSHHHGSHIGVSEGNHMQMHFQFGVDTVILFKDWSTSTKEGLVGSVVGIFLMAMLYEGIKFFREHLFKKYFTSLEYSSVSVLGDDGKPVTEVHKVARNRMFSCPHLIQTLLHVVQMVLSYFLMLIFMTYNVWLCLAVVLGAGAGYFLFGWRKATVVDITEHCH